MERVLSDDTGDDRARGGGRGHWFEALADHLGAAYLRYSFTRGTTNEVDFLVDALALRPGMRLLDVGCGPGRHAHELANRGIDVVGVDISQRFLEVARTNAVPASGFVRADARALPFSEAFDAAISLCQGAFGLGGPRAEPAPDPDQVVLEQVAAALRPGGRLALSAFSAYFQVRYLEDGDQFDAATGVNHERSVLRNERGETAEHDLWTTCFTPRELRLLAAAAGFDVDAVYSVTPGDYADRPPVVDRPEFLVLATRRDPSAR